jgi:hypothetical protein
VTFRFESRSEPPSRLTGGKDCDMLRLAHPLSVAGLAGRVGKGSRCQIRPRFHVKTERVQPLYSTMSESTAMPTKDRAGRRWTAWHTRVALLALVCLLAGVPVSPLVTLGPPQTVRTINPKMGIHTRLTDEVEPWKIKLTLEMVREMGTPWIVEYFPWAYHEPAPGRFDWTHADLVVDHARRQGLAVIARLGFVPEWARPDPEDPGRGALRRLCRLRPRLCRPFPGPRGSHCHLERAKHQPGVGLPPRGP